MGASDSASGSTRGTRRFAPGRTGIDPAPQIIKGRSLTLIITAITKAATVQASDRRITIIDPITESVTWKDDNVNKTIYLRCKDAHVVMAYTGLATVGAQQIPTYQWLSKYLTDVVATGRPLEELMTEFSGPIMGFFRSESSRCPITIVTSGFYYDGRPIRRVFSSEKTFSLHPIKHKNENVYIHGCTDGVAPYLETMIVGMSQDGLFRRLKPERIAEQLVSIMRLAASHPNAKEYIGRNCMTAMLSRSVNGSLHAKYYPDGCESTSYFPAVLYNGSAFGQMVAKGANPSFGPIEFANGVLKLTFNGTDLGMEGIYDPPKSKLHRILQSMQFISPK